MKLLAKNLIKTYGGRRVVNNLSMGISQNEIVGLLGPNGAGKTTSFYMSVGMISPEEGEILFDKKDITSLPMCDRAKLGIGYLPQESSVFRDLTVEENILAPLELMALTKKQREDRVEELLNEFNICHIRKSKGKVLSGGERRRVEIARLLTINPKIIGDSLDISPILVIASVTIGGYYFGIPGMFFGVPIASFLKVLIVDYIDKKIENKKIST